MPIKRLLIIMICFVLSTSFAQDRISGPISLVVSEGFTNPIGFYDNVPAFSWKLPVNEKVKTQSAYQIVVASREDLLPGKADLWDSKMRETSRSTWIKYQGEPLKSGQKVYWQVRYWNQDKTMSDWSEVNSIEMGLLSNSDWKGKWIGLDTAKDSIKGTNDVIIHKPQYLRKVFLLNSEVLSAKLYITAKGVFDIHLNGQNVSDDVMPPGWTPYNKRIETLTYDVTNLMESGQNTLSVELAAGWFAGRLGWSKTRIGKPVSPRILTQLEIKLADGTSEIIVSDETWKATTNGPIRFAEIYDGEIYDANFEMPNWTTHIFDDKNWNHVLVEKIENDVLLQPKRHFPVKTKQKISAKEIIKPEEGVIFDLKQNMVGVARVALPMKKGDTLRIRFSEMLSPDDSFYAENYRSAMSTDYYVASKDGLIEWSPKFTFHGFQFVELSGFDSSFEPSRDWVTGLVQYSDFEEQGTFTSSHVKLNQLQSNIVWGLRGNFFDIPTDCPQRDERLGWTGDAQVFAPTSMFNADVYAFWASWLQSLRETQFENGGIPFVIPDVLKNNGVSSGWGDAAVIIPWEVYYRTGDTSILEENFEMMRGWVSHHESQSKDYISDMNTFGDWLQPYPLKEKNNRGDTSKNLVSTAFFSYVAKLTARSAEVLNKPDEQKIYEALANQVSKAFENQFFDSKGKIINSEETQTGYLLALGFDLLSEDTKKKAIPNLLRKISEADNHLRTGFLGTPLLSRVLDQIGETDLMRDILFKETYPSWFHSINQGATTIWERWNSYDKAAGYNPESMNSLNHYAYGAVGQWMYERLAGIAPLEAGYKKIRIAPISKEPLTSASATLNTPFGIVSSSWIKVNNVLQLKVILPPNTSAEIEIPAITSEELFVNGVAFNANESLKLIERGSEGYRLIAQAGTYKFEIKIK